REPARLEALRPHRAARGAPPPLRGRRRAGGDAPRAPPLVREPPARPRRRPQGDPGAARPPLARQHAGLHPRLAEPPPQGLPTGASARVMVRNPLRLALALALVAAASCAKREPPSGGPPDIEPPR